MRLDILPESRRAAQTCVEVASSQLEVEAEDRFLLQKTPSLSDATRYALINCLQ
jgi:hypothetical protein